MMSMCKQSHTRYWLVPMACDTSTHTRTIMVQFNGGARLLRFCSSSAKERRHTHMHTPYRTQCIGRSRSLCRACVCVQFIRTLCVCVCVSIDADAHADYVIEFNCTLRHSNSKWKSNAGSESTGLLGVYV